MVEAADVGELLQHIQAVAPQRQFSIGAGFETGSSFRLEAPASKSWDHGARND